MRGGYHCGESCNFLSAQGTKIFFKFSNLLFSSIFAKTQTPTPFFLRNTKKEKRPWQHRNFQISVNPYLLFIQLITESVSLLSHCVVLVVGLGVGFVYNSLNPRRAEGDGGCSDPPPLR